MSDGIRPDSTYELRIVFDDNNDNAFEKKEEIKAWLTNHGVESFVEGVVDSIDVEHDYDNPDADRYESFGGDRSPISIYKYDRNWLTELRGKLNDEFSGDFVVEIYEHDTREWTEGWKESFRPFSTEKFYVRPPWEPKCSENEKIEVVIDPGMAFGTGQHATTKVCLHATENLHQQGLFTGSHLLDVGAGSGILAIAAKKLAIENVYATDIDPDSVISAEKNAKDNAVDIEVSKGSVIDCPDANGWDVMYANILSVVLKRIIDDIYKHLKKDGLVIMSGIIAEEEQEMTDLALSKGFQHMDTLRLDGWIGLVLRK